MIEYKIGVEAVDWAQLVELYGRVGLVAGLGKKRDAERIRQAFVSSAKVVTAWDGNALVAAGRLVGDGVCQGMIFDVGVLPEYQQRGIGAGIVRALVEGNEHLCLHLTATFGKEGFYRKLGFKRHRTAMARYPYASEYLED